MYVTITQEKEAVHWRVGCQGRGLRASSQVELEGGMGDGESSVILLQLETFKKKNKFPFVTMSGPNL